jgi:hypothetical protein
MHENNKKYTQDQVDLMSRLQEMSNDIKTTQCDIKEIKDKLEADFVTRGELKLLELKLATQQEKVDFLQKIIYGIISLIVLTVIGGMVTWFINSPKIL